MGTKRKTGEREKVAEEKKGRDNGEDGRKKNNKKMLKRKKGRVISYLLMPWGGVRVILM
jgi:hypothetical protein